MATYDGLGGVIVPQAYQKVATSLRNVVQDTNIVLYVIQGPEDETQLLGGVLQLVDGPVTREPCGPCEGLSYPLSEANIVSVLDANYALAWPINIYEIGAEGELPEGEPVEGEPVEGEG